MIKHTLKFQYIITQCQRHLEVKQELLKLIEKCPSLSIEDDKDFISKSDWHVPNTIERPYINLFLDSIKPELDIVMEELKQDLYKVTNYWFQQYSKNNYHKEHQHRGASYACVYFLELPEDGPKTTLIEPQTGRHIETDVKEGDILVFPAITWHYSPPNNSSSRKTIIAVNIN